MKHSIKFSLLGGVLLFSLSMCLTSCEGALDDVLGEWSRPTPGNNTNTTPTTSSTYRVYTSGTSYTDEALPTSGVTTEANITNTWTGDIVISSDKTLTGDVTLSGDVNLIIKDGAELKVNGQILGTSNDLKIYGQSESSGKLTVDAATQYNIRVKNLEVHGCVIKGTSADQSIENSSSGTIKIYNGTVDVTGNTNGIMAQGDLTIYGGTVKSSSTQVAISLYGCSLAIEGGTVSATSASATAIDSYTGTASINISGGTVTATGGNNSSGDGGHGISISNGNISISGSSTSVTAIGGDGGTGATDKGGHALYVNKAYATILITGGTINATAGNATGGGGYAIYAYDGTTINAAVIFNGGCDVTATAAGTDGVGICSNILTVSGSATKVNATGKSMGILAQTTVPGADIITINDGTVFGKATADGAHGITGTISYKGGVIEGEGGSGGRGFNIASTVTNNSGAAITVGYKSTSGVDWTGADVAISGTIANFDRYMIMPKP